MLWGRGAGTGRHEGRNSNGVREGNELAVTERGENGRELLELPSGPAPPDSELRRERWLGDSNPNFEPQRLII